MKQTKNEKERLKARMRKKRAESEWVTRKKGREYMRRYRAGKKEGVEVELEV